MRQIYGKSEKTKLLFAGGGGKNPLTEFRQTGKFGRLQHNPPLRVQFVKNKQLKFKGGNSAPKKQEIGKDKIFGFKGIIKFWNMPSYLHGSIEVRSRIIFYFIHTCRILPF